MKQIIVRNAVIILTVLIMIALTFLSTRTADVDAALKSNAPSAHYTATSTSTEMSR